MGAAVAAVGAMPAGEDRGVGGAVDLRQGHQHRRLDRAETACAGRPLAEGLELERVGGDVRHVEGGEDVGGGTAVVVGGSADEAEAGEGDEGVDLCAGGVAEVGLDGRARVEAGGEGRDDAQAARFAARAITAS